MCSASQPSSRAMRGGDAQREALLAEQRVAAVARAVRPDRRLLGEVDDVLVLVVARPRHVGLARGERRADGVQAAHEVAVAERVEHGAPHARHDPHADGDVGRVGELHADVGDRGADRAHAERDHVERAAAHRPAVERGQRLLHLARRHPVVGGAGVVLLRAADEGAILDARDVARVGAAEVRVRPLLLVQADEGAALDHLGAEAVVLLLGAVAPVHGVRLAELDHLVDPLHELLVRHVRRGVDRHRSSSGPETSPAPRMAALMRSGRLAQDRRGPAARTAGGPGRRRGNPATMKRSLR